MVFVRGLQYRWGMEIEISSELTLFFFIRCHLSREARLADAGLGWTN